MSIRERGLYTGLDAHEERQLRAQRDDAVDTLAAVTPLVKAAIALRKLELHGQGPDDAQWNDAARYQRDVIDRYVEEYGEEL